MGKLITLFLFTIFLVACAKKEQKTTQLNMANPASVYCESIDGKLEMVKDKKGWYGLCHLPDDITIEEWDLYRSQYY